MRRIDSRRKRCHSNWKCPTYSPLVTAQAIAAANAEQGWDLQAHSQAQIDAAIAHFDGLWDPETGKLSRGLTKDESRFISNERKLAALDFRYYLKYCTIVDWEKNSIHPTLNVAQAMVMDIWGEHEDRGIAIILLHLKARQLGISTLYELAECHRFQFWKNSNVIIASADPKKTVEMGQMIKYNIDSMPWWMIPTGDVKYEKNMIVEFGELNTRLSIQAGNQFHGVARGATPNCGHLSEVSSWDNAEEDIDASFIRAIHETPHVFVGLESTALGRDNWFSDTWNIVKEDWPRGRSRIRGVFLPWFVGTDIYPPVSDLWRFQQMVSHGWEPNERTVNHAERARTYVLANPLLFEHLAKGNADWKMPIEQMWYYETERDTAMKKKTLNKFLSEMPADDTEAFQNTGLSVIDQDVILNYRERVRVPKGVYAIIGDGIHRSLVPPRNLWLTGPTAPPVVTVRAAGIVRSTETYQFIPLKFEGYAGYDPMFKLFIWEWPEEGEEFGVGVDTSDGIGQDWSVLEVGRKPSHRYPLWTQCAEYASPYIKAEQLWPMALAVSAFYSVMNFKIGKRSQCRVAVECRGNGEIVQSEMQARGWINFHPWKRYDNKKPIADGKVHKMGVFTNQWFRSMMMDKFLTLVDEETLDICSPWLVNEMATLERDPDEKSARAAYNTHDDRVLGLGFVIFSMDPPGQFKRDRTYRQTGPQYLPQALDEHAQRSGSYATFTPGLQSMDLANRLALPVARGRRGTAPLLGPMRRPHSGRGW